MDAAGQGDGPSAAVFRNAGCGAVLRTVAASLRISAGRGGWRQVDADHPAGRGHRRDEAGSAAVANLAEGSRAGVVMKTAAASAITEAYIRKTPLSQERYAQAREIFPSGVTHDVRYLRPH